MQYLDLSYSPAEYVFGDGKKAKIEVSRVKFQDLSGDIYVPHTFAKMFDIIVNRARDPRYFDRINLIYDENDRTPIQMHSDDVLYIMAMVKPFDDVKSDVCLRLKNSFGIDEDTIMNTEFYSLRYIPFY